MTFLQPFKHSTISSSWLLSPTLGYQVQPAYRLHSTSTAMSTRQHGKDHSLFHEDCPLVFHKAWSMDNFSFLHMTPILSFPVMTRSQTAWLTFPFGWRPTSASRIPGRPIFYSSRGIHHQATTSPFLLRTRPLKESKKLGCHTR